VTCTDAFLDCQGDGTPDASCTFTGDTEGTLGQQPPSFPGVPGVGGFFLTCIPPALGGSPGVTAVCTAVTTDGDLDCDKTKTVEVTCPGLSPCDPANPAAPDCDDLDDCTADSCDESSGSAVCVNDVVPDGTVCTSAPAPASCQAGACVSSDCNAQPNPDLSCQDGNACTVNACNAPPATDCSTVPVGAGGACDAGAGASSGACDGAGGCTDICSFNPACPDDTGTSAVCTVATCDPADGTCGQAPTNEGGTCDFNPGAGDGSCVGGTCIFTPPDCGTTSGTVQIGCTNGVTTAQSPFPNQLSVTVNEPVFAGAPFDVDASGIGAFPKFFLDAAQSTVPGGVRSAIVEGFNVTVEANNGSGQILLQADPSGISPGLTQFCTFPTDQTCTADGDCLVPPCNPPVLLAGVPLSEDCGAGGFCESIGQGFADGAGSQCNITAAPEFCVSGDLAVPLFAPGGTQTLTAGAGPGDVVFNWAVDPLTEVCGTSADAQCAANGGTIPDGGLILPNSIYGDPVNNPASVGLNGIRLNVAGALFVALQCSAGQDGGACSGGTNDGLACGSAGDCPGGGCFGVGVDDDIIVPTNLATVPTRCPIN
jgi:hypothetical protein